MSDDFFDIMEMMEGVVPEYSYTNVKCAVETDAKVKQFLVSEIKKVKDVMFHVVQVGFELQRDKLSMAAEAIWDETRSLAIRAEVSRTCGKKGKKACDACTKKVEKDLRDLIRRDKELVTKVREMKAVAHSLHRTLLEKGRENYFIKNLDKIKVYTDEIASLMKEREKIVTGW